MMLNGRAPRILVTDGHSTSALSVVRSLGSRGMSVTVAGERSRFNLAAHSRYVSRVVTWPAAEEHPLAYAEQLTTELERGSYDLLVPVSDTTVTIVSHQRSRLQNLVRVALPENEALEAALDKQLTISVARATGVDVPRTYTFDSVSQLEQAAPHLTYPCVVKPRFSRYWTGTGPIRRGTVRYAASAQALNEIYRKCTPDPALLLVQELVAGEGVGVFVLADHGHPRAVFVHRRLREANPTGGRASMAESASPEERLTAPALRLLRALRWHGVAMIEFKDTGAPRAPVIMEINGRFWGSLPLAIAAGVDFPALLAQLSLGLPIVEPPPYSVGLRCRHLKGDLSFLAAAVKGRPSDWTGAFPGRVSALAAIAPWPGRWRPYNFRLNDPMPGLYEAADFLIQEARGLIVGRTLRQRRHVPQEQ